MLRPVTTSTTGPTTIVELAERGQPCGRGALDAETDLPERGDGSCELPLGDEQHAVGGRLERGDRERDGHAHRQAVGERRGAVTRNRALGAPALDHDRRLARGDTDAQSRRRTLAERSADPGEQRAIPDGNDDGSRRFGKLLEHFGGNRRIPVELRGLGTVLEERHVLLFRPRTSLVLRIVDVGAREPGPRLRARCISSSFVRLTFSGA